MPTTANRSGKTPNRPILIDLASGTGIKRQVAEILLKGDEGMDAFKEAGELSRLHRVDGVPFFMIDKKITLSGAQEPETFIDAIQQAIGSQ